MTSNVGEREVTREEVEKLEGDRLKDIDIRLGIWRDVARISKGLPYIQYFDLQIRSEGKK